MNETIPIGIFKNLIVSLVSNIGTQVVATGTLLVTTFFETKCFGNTLKSKQKYSYT